MDIFRIEGPTTFDGVAVVQGSKNAVLPMMAAAVLAKGVTLISNCPDISDVRAAMDILTYIGCRADYTNGELKIDSTGDINAFIPENMMNRIRASFLFAGALLARCGEFRVYRPGGCNIGLRPLDIHIESMRLMGAEVVYTSDEIRCLGGNLTGCDITIRFPSVGATENIMLLASTTRGTTRILNAAREPEIEDLQNMLNSMGARIIGAGTRVIEIEGVPELRGTSYAVMPDRIDAATYISAVCINGGSLTIENADAGHLSSYINILKRCGAQIECTDGVIRVFKPKRLNGGVRVHTLPYPGFATDMQSLLMAALTLSDGISLIRENIFENRFCISNALRTMGADIRVYGSTASISGVEGLRCTDARVCDLRSGAALALAMMSCEGVSHLSDIHYIDRGYEKFEDKYRKLGARIERIEKTYAG